MRNLKNIHYGWWVSLGLVLVQSAVFGILVNCAGIVFSAIIVDLGFKAGDLSVYYTLRAITTAVTIPITMKLFFKYNSRIVMAVFGVMASLSFGGMYFFNELWQWYIAAVLAGAVMALLMVCIPIVINNWFNVSTGLVMGVVLSSSGLVGAIYSPIFAGFIESYGWRMASLITGGLIFLLSVIPSLLVVDSSPEKVNKTAYGIKPEIINKHQAKKQIPGKMIYVMCVCVPLFMGTVSQFANQIPTYANSLGFAASVGATFTSFAMVGNVLSKMIFGVAYDKFGVFKSLKGTIFITAFAIVLYLITNNIVIICIASLLFGAVYSITLIAVPMLIKDMYGDENYKSALGRVQSVSNFCIAFLSLLIPYIYDFTGTFNLFFIIAIIVSLVTIISVVFLEKYAKSNN